ncbi:MAG: S8 family serine peptidase [Polyangiaceae bacterium]|nr:S8 family serine peptidase [Polyangiaceae bacterium]
MPARRLPSGRRARAPVHTVAGLVAAALVTRTAGLSAQVDARRLVLPVAPLSPAAFPPFVAPAGRATLVVRHAPGLLPAGVVSIAPGIAIVSASPDDLARLERDHPEARARWSPPLRPWLDRADGWVHAGIFRNLTGVDGAGVLVGIVDTGVDPTHPDLRAADGRTRIAFHLDLSRPALGRLPELEEEYGCTGRAGFTCAIYDSPALDEAMNNSVAGDEPRDPAGHGTHVASIAAGNDVSSNPPRFVGVAPGATLVTARVARGASGAIYDADVLLAVRFIFERAAALGLPAVVNLSLGGDFGAHDGSSDLEQGLASFVGPDQPGRAIVVAAGNSGGVFTGLGREYPEPLGIHTVVHVPPATSTRVPLLIPVAGPTARGTVFVWVGLAAGSTLRVGIDDRDGPWIEPLDPARGTTKRRGKLAATVVPATAYADQAGSRSQDAVVVLDGEWPAEETYALRLEGNATVALWAQSQGELGPDGGAPGALFPRARKQGTIAIPATHPELIGVGATLNRTSWADRNDHSFGVEALGALEDPPGDSVAYFSGAGPTLDGRLKPDLLAPGAYVAAAMTQAADPSRSETSMFAAPCATGNDCMVLDDRHALASGTSMAAPFVTGAAALLMARDPGLTQPRLLALLQAGVRRPHGVVTNAQQVGAGALELDGSLAAALGDTSPLEPPSPVESWIALADAYVRPDPAATIEGVLELRTAAAALADGFDPGRLAVEVGGARLASGPTRVAPGLYRFELSADAGTGGGEARVLARFDGERLAEARVPIAVDPHVAAAGFHARGGCAVGARASEGGGWAALGGLGAWAARRRRRR